MTDTTMTTEEDFEAFYRCWQPLVFSVLRSRAREQAYQAIVEDLAQETFFKAWQSGQWATANNPKTWLATIARNTARDFFKSAAQQGEKWRTHLEEEEFHRVAEDEGSVQTFSLIEAADRIRAAFQALNAEDQRIFLLLLREYRAADLASVFNISAPTAWRWVERTRKNFLRVYQGDLMHAG